MRWLMIGLIVSLGALLIAAAGAARHIWLRRHKPGIEAPSGAPESGDEADSESEL